MAVSGHLHHMAVIFPGEDFGTHGIGDRVGLRVGLVVLEREKAFCK
jgi:hypothetical protein